MSGEDHASQVLSLPGKEWGDQSRGPQGELISRTFSLAGSSCALMMMLTSCGDLVQLLLVGTGFTEQTEEQYFQFLAKFEIALPVANNR